MRLKPYPDLEKKAEEYFLFGYNDAEAILKVILGHLGEEGPKFIKLVTGLGAGFGRMGETCGAITGGILAISYKFGRISGKEDKHNCYKLVRRFVGEFKNRFGTIRCSELRGGFDKDRRTCLPYITYAVRLVMNIIEENAG
jgi:C_GCAxxG_C_C family probable redox protein